MVKVIQPTIIGASLSEPHSIVATDEISVCLYGGQLSVYLFTLINPTGCDKLNCIAIVQPLVHVHHAVYCFVNLDSD